MKMKRSGISKFLIACALISFFAAFESINKKYSNSGEVKIGILQFVEHEALDFSRKGFIDGLKESEQMRNIKVIYRNAQGDQSNCTLIANQFVAENCDLILAIATPAAQSVAAVTSQISVLVTAVTNPEDVDLVKSNKMPGTNVTGTSDLAPIAEQVKLVKKINPKAKKLGILFSSSEANSKYQSEIAIQEAEKIGLEPHVFTFSQMSEIQAVVESMAGKVDAIYTPTDNMVASNMELISRIASSFEIPVICGEDNLISKGATATYGINYYDLGKETSKQAEKILINGMNPKYMPIKYASKNKLILNFEMINKLGIEISEDLKSEL